LREGQALADVAAPSRIVVGPKGKLAEAFVELLRSCAVSSKSPVALMGSSEAEACKLYSNAYLAMRVAFFNELDSGCMALGLDARQVVQGVCMDPRIGQHYNNPSFGYGGYCLPKDTRQLAADCSEPVLPLLAAIVASNTRRIEFIAGEVVAKAPKIVGAYLLAMKAGSGNARSASAIEVSKRLIAKGIDLWVHDPSLSQAEVSLLVPGARLVESLSDFLSGVDLVMANRDSKDLASARSKVFTRDLFGLD
jgi:UDPglucose 6-dehydrogenase